MTGTVRVLAPEKVFSRIGTREPYYALKALAADDDGSVDAEVPVELRSDLELGPITAAEAARHLGILGMCAVAQVHPRRELHYYLSKAAVLERASLTGGSKTRPLDGRATAQFISKGVARARATLAPRGGPRLFTLAIEYRVLSATEFAKLFQSVRRDLRGASRPPVDERHATGELRVMRSNPYGAPLTFKRFDASPGGDVIEASLGPIDTSMCNGHYPMYPVLPTGLVMSALSQLCGELLRRRKGDVQYVVRHAQAAASELAVVGETVRFEARYVGGSARNHRFECRAHTGTKSVGEAALTLALAT